MDGLHDRFAYDVVSCTQRTLASSIACRSAGLHSGVRATLTLHPAPADHGIIFLRSDLGIRIPALAENVVDTRLCTVLGADGARVATVEHVMAALAGSLIDNALIEIDGPEVPILDGSAADFLFLIDCAGVVEQNTPRRAVEVLKTVRVSDGAAFAELRPTGLPFLDLSMSIDFDAPAIGRQALSIRLNPHAFRGELSRARTFTQAAEIEALRAAGLARGGSLENAVVVDGPAVLNPGGLRMQGEFVRHKLLDAVGDLALAGGPVHGQFIGFRSGHALNNRVTRALLADPGSWRFADPAPFQMVREAA